MKTIRYAAGLTTALLAFSAQSTIVTNGNFELGGFAPPGQATMTVANGSMAITGWQVVNDAIAWLGVANPWRLAAQSGNLFLDLTGPSAGAPFGGVQQILSTAAGAQYEVSFYLGSSNLWGRPAGIEVSAGSVSETFKSPLAGTVNDWELHSMRFTASGATTTLRFAGAAGVNYIGLDNVAVNLVSSPVPLPSTLLLLLACIPAIPLVRRPRPNLKRQET